MSTDEFENIPEKEPVNSRTVRRQERRERRANREAGGSGWLIGLVLILIGGVYLLGNMGVLPDFELNNWWALFILLPAAGALSGALGAYRNNGGQFTMDVIFPAIAGILFLLLTASFLFDIGYGWLWPLFLIAGGLMLLASPLVKHQSNTDV